MSLEPDERHEQQDLATSTHEGSADFLYMVRQLLVAVGGDPDGVVQKAEQSVRKLKEQHAGFRSGHTREDARRRLQNARLRTPTPDNRSQGLVAKRLELKGKLARALQEAIPVALELAYVEAELAEVGKLKKALDDGREKFKQTGLYPETLKFVADMYSEYGVTYAHFAAMNPDERAAIAQILQRRKT